MDFLFSKGRTPWTFTDHQATKIGAIFERDLAHGEALTTFGDELEAKAAAAMEASHVEEASEEHV